MDETNRFNTLRLRYRAAFDAYRTIATRHAEALSFGRGLSREEQMAEERAAAALEKVREAIKAAGISRFDR